MAKQMNASHPVCRLAIIGSGFASFCLVAHLLNRHAILPSVITVIGPQPFGFGAAYGCQHKDFRLNVRAQIMRIFPDQPNDFRDWAALELADKEAHNAQGSFYRRADFAAYLSDFKHHLKGFDEICFLSDVVNAVRPAKLGWQLSLGSGQNIEAENVVVASGNPPPNWPVSISKDVPTGKAIENPWSGSWLDQVEPKENITFMGGGLTAMDGIYSLARQNHQGLVQVVLPHLILPPKQTDWQEEQAIIWPKDIRKASHFLRFMLTSLDSRNWTEASWQSRFEALRIHINQAWQQLDDDAQRRVICHAGHWWQLARFRSAPQTFDAAMQMQKNGQLQLIKGRVSAIGYQQENIQLVLQDGTKLWTDKLVNCTGPSRDRLAQQMINEGVVDSDRTGRTFRVSADYQAIDGQKQPIATLFGLGAMTAGSLGDVIGAGSIAKQAERLAARLAKDFTERK